MPRPLPALGRARRAGPQVRACGGESCGRPAAFEPRMQLNASNVPGRAPRPCMCFWQRRRASEDRSVARSGVRPPLPALPRDLLSSRMVCSRQAQLQCSLTGTGDTALTLAHRALGRACDGRLKMRGARLWLKNRRRPRCRSGRCCRRARSRLAHATGHYRGGARYWRRKGQAFSAHVAGSLRPPHSSHRPSWRRCWRAMKRST